jgi:hypothetical protein
MDTSPSVHRYAHSAVQEAVSSKASLEEAKENLNEVTHENEQLRMAVGKAR